MSELKKCPHCGYIKEVLDLNEVENKCNVLLSISDSLKKMGKKIECAKEYCGSSSMAFEGTSGEISSIDDTLDELKELAEKQGNKAESLVGAIIGAAKVDYAKQISEYESHVNDCPENPKNKLSTAIRNVGKQGDNSFTCRRMS